MWYNYKECYKDIIIVLKTRLVINVDIVIVQKLFIYSWDIYYNDFNFY